MTQVVGAKIDPQTGKITSCRMFETPLIEAFSRVHPALPFVFWLPIAALIGARAIQLGISPGMFVVLFLAGWLTWSLAEYLMHRYIFHFLGAEPWKRRFHFIIHGVHHDYPDDASRLVMPIGASIPIGVVFYSIFLLLFGEARGSAAFVGFGVGYLAYDGIHFAVHHFRLTSSVGRWLKKHHMQHHHTGIEAKWGVSSPLWDYVFGTMDDKGRGKA